MPSVPTQGPPVPPPAPVWDAQPPTSGGAGYGGFWIRVVAYLIDAVILGIVGSVLFVVVGGMHVLRGGHPLYDHGINLVSLVIGWLYFALMESSERGATLGKMAVGLRVVTDRGERLSFANATGRYFAKFISAMLLCIGFIMVAFTDKKQGLHDMMARTLVIKVR
ncbi:Uncharacterized membrane protein YckC, RDD family [Enhydrobacter aerosaccus]|uniref:Uncharacterized membrane protein YckC, RDD family n=1 Tax=Enhydrobacter aerosaccus TaxID=225324 RepID=A0A1T4SH61_9HYPH|nr:RDD family protein [Enhydrobacter aerosaccus]SKA27496.1 Uncharacterized membrane protein YckC, RDD family [Enhydrobacter aerosaccus]